MPRTWACPYYIWEEGLVLHCQGATLRFKNKEERREFVYPYCAAVPGWEKCTIARQLQKRNERCASDGKKKCGKNKGS